MTREQELREDVERLRQENADLRRWKALDKPLTAAMAIANSHLVPLRAEIERLRAENKLLFDHIKGDAADLEKFNEAMKRTVAAHEQEVPK